MPVTRIGYGVIAIVALVALAISCGSSETETTSGRAPSDRADAGDAGDADAGFEMRGAARCCLEGFGTSCCDGLSPDSCDEYGGFYGRCIPEGESYEGKVLCAKCCDGLIRAGSNVLGDAIPPEVDRLKPGCDPGATSRVVCLRCGDGVCGTGETYCNCPRDCPVP